MKTNLYVVRDDLSGVAPMVYCYSSDALAKRAFMDSVYAGRPTSTEKDLDVLRVGQLDTETGIITPLEKNEVVICGYNVHHKKLEEANQHV